MAAPLTLIPVLYRDADGHEEIETYAADGAISDEQMAALRASLVDGDGFIPTQIGLDHLGHHLDQFPTESDHCWHAVLADRIEVTESPAGHPTRVGDLTQFVDRFTSVGSEGWDASASPC